MPSLMRKRKVLYTLRRSSSNEFSSSGRQGSTRQTGAGAHALHKGLPPPVALTTTRGTAAPLAVCLVPIHPISHFQPIFTSTNNEKSIPARRGRGELPCAFGRPPQELIAPRLQPDDTTGGAPSSLPDVHPLYFTSG